MLQTNVCLEGAGGCTLTRIRLPLLAATLITVGLSSAERPHYSGLKDPTSSQDSHLCLFSGVLLKPLPVVEAPARRRSPCPSSKPLPIVFLQGDTQHGNVGSPY